MNPSQNPVTNRFADYFVICGLDISSGLELDRFSGDTLHCSPLDRPYKSKVLAHYPDNVPWNIFDHEAVSMLCLPHGLQFRTQKNSLEPCFHSFITTREDGRRTYGFSLVFFEEVTDRRICSAMQTLQAMHLTEVSSKKAPLVVSGSGRKNSKRSHHQGVMEGASHSTRSLPRHFKLSTHKGSIGSALEECHASTNPNLQAYYDASQDSLYASKSIALVCQLPFVRAAQKFLIGLYKYAVDLANEEEGTVTFNCDLFEGISSEINSGELSLESHVHNLLYEVRVPQPGRSMRFCCFGEPIVVQRPSSIEEPPLFDFPLRELFTLVGGPKCLLELFTCLLLENQVLLYSSDYQRLMLVAESITCLLFPFAWQHVYVPILPSSLTHFLDAPVPFVMGLPGGYQAERGSGSGPWSSPAVCLSCRSHRTKLASEANLCFVDIDSHTIQLPEDLPQFPQQEEFIGEIRELLTQYGVPSGDIQGKGVADSGPSSKSCPSCSHHRHKHHSRNKHHHHSRRKHSFSHDSDSASSSSSPTHSARYAAYDETGKRRGSTRRAAAAAAAAAAVGANSPASDGVKASSPYNSIPQVETSEALKRILAIAANARVNVSDLNVVPPATNLDSNRVVEKVRTEQEQYVEDLKFNNALREVFLNRFVHIFSAYEHFVIQPDQDMEQWLSSRDSMQNFDKATFLSDQPEPYLPFLSRFIESQMFATLIDNKILSCWQEVDPNLRVFDRRIRLLRKRFGDSLVRTPSYEPCTAIKDSQLLLEKRLASVDFTSAPPRPLPTMPMTTRARERARRKRHTNLSVQDVPKLSLESSAEALSSHALAQASSVLQSDNCNEVSSRQLLEDRLESTLERLQGQLERTKILDGVGEVDSESGNVGNKRPVLNQCHSQESRTVRKHPPFPLLDPDALNREPARPPRKRVTSSVSTSSSSHHPQKDRQMGDEETMQSRILSKCEEDGEKDSGTFGSRDVGKNNLISSTEKDHQKMEVGRSRMNSSSGESLLKTLRQPKLSGEPSPAEIAQTNWNFVEALLKDVKMRTKRMLVEKMGSEAVELGHGTAASLSGLEENTLMASLCDLLERIWSHGLQSKQGKSALWSHLLNFQELEDCNDSSKIIDPNSLTPAIPTPPKLGFSDLIFTIKSKNILEIATFISNFDLSSMALETDLNLPRNGKFSTLPSCSRRSVSTDRNPQGGASSPSPSTPQTKISGDDQSSPPPLPVSVTFDMRNVQGMSEIKTDIGYARAWVRLSLEKKLLSAHLRTLLSDHALLRSLYKRYAFLRSDDEREQFLYHLLTLNAVDYFCFTNTYTTIRIPYRVVIFPMKKGGATTTSANAWVAAAGTLGGTNPVKIPKGSLEFVFHHKNLGILTTLRIGHDNTGPSPKWMVEHVIVRNEITGHSYKFPCGRWLGRGVDDDSTERLLVGEMIAWQSPDGSGAGPMGLGSGGSRARGGGSRMGSREDLLDAEKCRGDVDLKRTPQQQRRGSFGSGEMNRCSTPPPPNPPPMVMSLFPSPTQLLQYSPPSLSPSAAASNRRRTPTVPEIQQMLGDAVNSIVKYYYRPKQEKEGLTLLLCGEMGLVHCLAQVFLHGFKSTRLFGKNLYLWDYFVKVKEEFVAHIAGEKREGRRSESRTRGKDIVRQYCRLIERICNSSRTLGKDGKFQLFVCLGVREHLLHRMIAPLSTSRTTLEMFEEYSFLRNPSLSTFLCQILQSLDEFEFVLENSLTKGMMDTL